MVPYSFLVAQRTAIHCHQTDKTRKDQTILCVVQVVGNIFFFNIAAAAAPGLTRFLHGLLIAWLIRIRMRSLVSKGRDCQGYESNYAQNRSVRSFG